MTYFLATSIAAAILVDAPIWLGLILLAAFAGSLAIDLCYPEPE